MVLLMMATLPACETAKRLAPPGLIKYEDLAKDIPVNPVIQQRIDEAGSNRKARYPNLSDAPQVVPTGLSAQRQQNRSTRMIDMRKRMIEDIERARSGVEVEFGLDGDGVIDTNKTGAAGELAATVEELEKVLEETRSEIEAEVVEPLPDPIDTTGAGEQEDPFIEEQDQ